MKKKMLSNFDSIINDLYLVYNIYFENYKNQSNSNDNSKEKELINNVFEIFRFFWEELIIFSKKIKIFFQKILNFYINY